MVYHAGTAQKGRQLVTAGGRVLGVTATAPTLEQAIEKAYAASGRIGLRACTAVRTLAGGRWQR